MAQRGFPYEYEIEEGKSGLTALGGLPTYLDLASAAGLLKAIDKHLKICTGDQGWKDRQLVMSLVLLNLAGGSSVDDINKLEGDEGFCRIVRKVEEQGLTRKERRELKGRWRKGRRRTLTSASAIFRYLANFHDAEQEKYRQEGKAFIPKANDQLKALGKINKDLIGFENKGENTATLDMDEGNALWVYKYSGAGDGSCPQVTGTDIGKSAIREAADRSTSENCPSGGISRLKQSCADKRVSRKDSLRDRCVLFQYF